MAKMSTFTRPSKAQYYSYRIGRGEQGVLTFEPYKSYLLPHWRFRTVVIARESSDALWREFLSFYDERDFVGMDMSRKFIQMGMTRAKRYANHKGGRKYAKLKEGEKAVAYSYEGIPRGKELERSSVHAGMEEKAEASNIFKAVWEKCKTHEGYVELRKEFLQGQKGWEAMRGDEAKDASGENETEAEENEGTTKRYIHKKGNK